MSDDATHKTLVDGKAVKLRASCDACNESKVRCSQTKPTCARCQKQGVRCIYGLSRRSHKTASRIGASSRLETSTSCSANSDSHTSSATAFSHLDSNAAGTHAPNDTTHQPLESLTTSSIHWPGEDIPRATTSDMLSPMSLQDYNVLGYQPSSSEDEHISQLDFDFMDFAAVDSSVPFDAAFDLPNKVSLTLGLHDKSQSLSQSLPSYENSSSPSCSSLLRAAILDKRETSCASSCRCTSEVIPQLLSIPFLFQDKTVKLDVQLSQLKGAMKICEDCIKCECTSSDKLAMFTVSILVGRIVEGFEMTLEKASSTSGSSTASSESSLSVTSKSSSCPQFSWGVLQIDGEDEANLRQHLWLLHFRKLEAVLKQFNASIRLIRNTQGSSVSSQVMACECMHMWLDQRAQVLRNRCFAQVGPGPTS